QHSHPVVRLDLDRVCVLCKAKSAKYAGAKGRPVDLWIGGEVSVVVTCSPVELGQWLHLTDIGNSTLQAHRHVGKFLAQCGRAGRLPVRTRQHGLLCMLMREGCEPGMQSLELWYQNLAAGACEHQRVRGIVDIF